MVLLGVDDFLEVTNSTLLVSDIYLICFGKLSLKSSFGWFPRSKDNCL